MLEVVRSVVTHVLLIDTHYQVAETTIASDSYQTGRGMPGISGGEIRVSMGEDSAVSSAGRAST
jgi:hypothetical protein